MSLQARSLHLTKDQSTKLIESFGINLSIPPEGSPSTHYLGISPDRSARSPSIIAAPTADPSKLSHRACRFPFDYRTGPTPSAIAAATAHMQLSALPPKSKSQLVQAIHSLWNLYTAHEAIDAHLKLALSVSSDELLFYDPYLFFDDAAFKSAKRQADLHALRDETALTAADREAEEAGIVYIPLSASSSSDGSSSSVDAGDSDPGSSEKSSIDAGSEGEVTISGDGRGELLRYVTSDS